MNIKHALALFAVMMPSFALADSYYIQPSAPTSGEESVNLDALVRAAVSAKGDHEVALENGKAQYTLRTNTIKLGAAYIVTLEKVKDKKVIYSSQLKALSIEEMDTIVTRLVRSVLNETPVKTDVQLTEVTETERTEHNRVRQTSGGWDLGFGPGFLFGLDAQKSAFHLDLGYTWSIDSFGLRLFYDLTSETGKNSKNANISGLGIGTQYFLSQSDRSAYVGGDLSYGTATAHISQDGDYSMKSSEADGFVLGGTVGYQLFRTARTKLDVGVRYGVMLATLNNKIPSTLGVKVGLEF